MKWLSDLISSLFGKDKTTEKEPPIVIVPEPPKEKEPEMTLNDFKNAVGCSLETATKWYTPIVNAMKEFNITTPVQQAQFIAQLAHETGTFKTFVESFNYSVAALKATFPTRLTNAQCEALGRTDKQAANQQGIANTVYANRLGNGDYASGDGWRYRGKGCIMLTFKNNYLVTGKAIGVDLVASPDLLVTQPNIAARAAGHFWLTNGCNAVADDVVKTTRIINGGTNGLDDRRARFALASKYIK